VLLGGLVVYRERFSRLQRMGAAVLIGGLLLFSAGAYRSYSEPP
jgi:hypothetical protein